MSDFVLLLLGGLIGWLGQYWVGRVQRKELFDHKLRLEKEYLIYTDLWERLFDFRKAAHGLVDSLQESMPEDPHGEFVEEFNAFQAVVRRNEPFICPHVFEHARAIVSQGRAIATALRRNSDLEERRSHVRETEDDERIAAKLTEAREDQETAVEEIDELCSRVKEAIRRRVTLNR